MGYKIRAQDLKTLKLNEASAAASVLQNIALILTTRQQSVPMHRSFGLPMRFIDKPISAAKALMTVEICDAIRDHEPRADVIGITYAVDESAPGRLVPTVEVEINEEP